jgi:hypothetical protein
MRERHQQLLLHLRSSYRNTIYPILPYLYLGGARSADDTDDMKLHGITHIVNVTADSKPREETTREFKVLYHPLQDLPDQSLFPCLSLTHAFIDDGNPFLPHVCSCPPTIDLTYWFRGCLNSTSKWWTCVCALFRWSIAFSCEYIASFIINESTNIITSLLASCTWYVCNFYSN